MRIAKLWFWITPLSCVSSIFLFAFGVSALSYFLTGVESVDVWTVFKVLETLPDPREFITTVMKVFNSITSVTKHITYSGQKPDNPVLAELVKLLNVVLNIFNILVYIFGFIVSLVFAIVLFPIYCVFFTFRCCGSMLTLLGVDMVYDFTHISLDQIFDSIFGGANIYA